MNLSAIDLNLLVALDALLRERSVTRAAKRVGLSQPAMSNALARLRALLDDPILMRVGNAMVPTWRAEALAGPVGRALALIETSLEAPEAFDPASASRSFRLSGVDTLHVLLLPRLVKQLSKRAPGIRVAMQPLEPSSEVFKKLEAGELDLAIGQFRSMPEGVRAEPLLEDRVVCAVRKGHPRIKRKPTLAQYLRESHLAIDPGLRSDLPFSVNRILEEKGLQRKVAASVPNLALAPPVVAQTDLVCTGLAQAIVPLRGVLGLFVFAPPLELPGIQMDLAWHRRVEDDPAHQWFRSFLVESCA